MKFPVTANTTQFFIECTCVALTWSEFLHHLLQPEKDGYIASSSFMAFGSWSLVTMAFAHYLIASFSSEMKELNNTLRAAVDPIVRLAAGGFAITFVMFSILRAEHAHPNWSEPEHVFALCLSIGWLTFYFRRFFQLRATLRAAEGHSTAAKLS